MCSRTRDVDRRRRGHHRSVCFSLLVAMAIRRNITNEDRRRPKLKVFGLRSHHPPFLGSFPFLFFLVETGIHYSIEHHRFSIDGLAQVAIAFSIFSSPTAGFLGSVFWVYLAGSMGMGSLGLGKTSENYEEGYEKGQTKQTGARHIGTQTIHTYTIPHTIVISKIHLIH